MSFSKPRVQNKSKDRLQTLLGKGWFPQELPNTFITLDFAYNYGKILKDWLATGVVEYNLHTVGQKYHTNSFQYKNLKWCEPEILSIPKKNYERRSISLTHPIPQSLLFLELSHNWERI